MIFFFDFVGYEFVSDPTRDDNVILGAIALLAENALERAAAFENEDDLVGAAVLVIFVLAVRFFRSRSPRGHVLVEKNRNSTGVEIAFARNARGLEMMMTERTVGDFLQLLALEQLHIANARRRPQVIHDGVSFVEALGRHDVLIVDTLVLVTRSRTVAMEPDVMLPRHLAELSIIRHSRSPLKCHPEPVEGSLTMRDVSTSLNMTVVT